MNFVIRTFGHLGLLYFALLSDSLWAGEWVNATVTSSEGASIYLKPDQSSPPAGKYPQGKSLKVYTPDQRGFYAIYFAQAWKGTHYVWILANSVTTRQQPQQNSAQAQSSRRSSQSRSRRSSGASGWFSSSPFYKNSIRVLGSFLQFRPSTFQSFLGDDPQSISSFSFGLEYERRFSPRWSGLLQVSRYSFKTNVVNSSVVSTTDTVTPYYFSNGYVLTIAPTYTFLTGKIYRISASVGVGISYNSAGNSADGADLGGADQEVTSTLLAFPLLVQVTGNVNIYNRLDGFLRAGYQYQVLGSVPVLELPLGTTLSNSSLNLSSFFLSLGFGYNF